ncbi:MAG: vanadium-dependent haloperoxidase [Chloroflexales bacterium]|nr:vanadium-dependent haloperoxidase [Chloroflexales bacterium]
MVVLVTSVVLSSATSMRAASPDPDAVTVWHNIAVQALATATPARPAPLPFLDIAVVQVAVHDAVQAIDRRFTPYHVTFPLGASGSPEAAAAKAAHDVLVAILPGQAASLDTHYHNYFTGHGLAENDPGVNIGALAAADILALRANDGRLPDPLPPPFTGGTAPGQWRPTPSLLPGPPPSLAPMASSWLATVPPFTLNSGDQFRADPPPPLSSEQYVKEYNEVKALGALTNSTRTPEQTQLATFFGGNLFILYNQPLRDVAAWQTDNIGDNARLLALGTLAIADAVITSWDSKKHYVYWRPITGIREGENDGNPQTVGDPNWQSFLNTPNYPDHTSGANSVAGALTRILELYLGTDQVSFTVVSTHPNAVPKTRTYTRFSDLSWDTVNVRIYQGIHFRTPDEAGRTQGRQVAEWVFGHVLQPIDARD